jgi:peptide/nickel transport system substrate-binding protein
MSAGPTRPVGYPGEAANDSYTWASPALDRLVKVDLTGKIVPQLAVSWTPSDDGKSIIIGLRKGVKFHDGSDFNAAVCKWNLDMQIAAKKTVEWTSIDVVDDYTIRINVGQYQNTMLYTLANGLTQQISKAYVDKNGIQAAEWHPVGTGPFIFDSYEKDAKMTFKRNPNYWDTGKPYLDGVEIIVIADSTVRKLAFEKGDIQRLAVSGLDAVELQKAGYEMITEPGGTYALVPDSNTAASPWANINVRLAASYALNRESLAKALGYGFYSPAYQLYPGFSQTAIPGLIKQSHDVAKAKDLLKQAGYPSGFKSVMHPFMVIPTDYSSAVINQLSDAGISVDLDKVTAAKYTELRYNGWDGLMNHAFANYANFVSSNDYFLGTQFPSFKRPAGLKEGYDAAASTKEVDPKLVQAIMQIIYDNVMVIPYIEEQRITFLQKGVHDPFTKTFTLMDNWVQEVWLDPSAR